jgi:hypothetical protein
MDANTAISIGGGVLSILVTVGGLMWAAAKWQERSEQTSRALDAERKRIDQIEADNRAQREAFSDMRVLMEKMNGKLEVMNSRLEAANQGSEIIRSITAMAESNAKLAEAIRADVEFQRSQREYDRPMNSSR